MRIPIILCPLLLVAPLFSQSEREAGRPVTCRFLSFGGNASTKSLRTKTVEGEGVSCPLPTNQLSEQINCKAIDNRIKFVTEGDSKPAGPAKIPASANSAILIFLPAPEGTPAASPWRILVIEDSAKNFPDGGAFVANFHTDDIRFVLGEHRGALRFLPSMQYLILALHRPPQQATTD